MPKHRRHRAERLGQSRTVPGEALAVDEPHPPLANRRDGGVRVEVAQMGVQLAVKYLKAGKSKAGIKPHYGTSSAIITRANVTSPAIKKFLYTP